MALPIETIRKILQAIDDYVVECSYFDTISNSMKTIKGYVPDVPCDIHSFMSEKTEVYCIDNSRQNLCSPFALKAIEM